MSSLQAVRLGVYTDYAYVSEGDAVFAERAFALFVARLSTGFERLVLIGRLNPRPGQARYRIPADVEFIPLPYYASLARPLPVIASLVETLRRFWRALDGVDAVWLLGPHPFAIAFAAMARARRRRVFLGVRQELPIYARHRHPGRRGIHLAGSALEAAYIALARRYPTVVIGPTLGQRYRHAKALLELTVSLIDDDDLVEPQVAHSRPYNGELRLLSVGRLAEEKNPLMLAEVLARLCEQDERRWRLSVCGEGPLEGALAAHLTELGVADRAELRGYVPFGDGLAEAYRRSHFLLHTSWTEGLPQILVEAFAAGLPVVATDVGGIRAAMADAAVLVSPGDADAAAGALRRLVDDAETRGRLIEAGLAYARQHTLDQEVSRLGSFLSAEVRPT